MSAPFIPDSAPFSAEQRAWLNGFLAGMFSKQAESPSAAAVEAKPVSILWGSQTGNSEGLARQVGKRLEAKGFAPKVYDMGEYDAAKLSEEKLVLMVTSTFGDGEPPDNAATLHSFLHSSDVPSLAGLKYSVLGLGDSNYPEFCKCAVDFDTRLTALGAEAIVPRVDCDVDYDETFEGWLKAVEESAGATDSGPAGTDVPSSDVGYGKKNPFPAKLITSYNLNGSGSAKETRHIEFSLKGSGLSYQPGDALAVMPENSLAYVTDFLSAAGFTGDESVGGSALRDLLLNEYDVTSLTAKGLKAYAEVSGSSELARIAGDKEAFKNFAWGRQFIDLLLEAPVSFAGPEALLGLLGKLAPRLYSISSSPLAHPDEVHVTVGVVRYDAHGRSRGGVCSNFLAEHDGDATVAVYFHPTSSFKLPEDPSASVVMVGPGTGIAPFRAFLEERSAKGEEGKNWLFFGDQHEACDFLYREQLAGFQESGVLDRLDTAFSRDQAEKVYVQDRMREQGAELFQWLEAGAYFYVCGDASRMAKDVDKALHELIATHGGLSAQAATEYVDTLKKKKRYLRDVY